MHDEPRGRGPRREEPRDYELELERIVGAIAESVFEMSDEEVEAELRADGYDPGEVAEEVREVLLAAVRRHRKQRLPRARAGYEATVAAIRRRLEKALSGTPAQKRARLAAAFRVDPGARQALTVQFRDLKSLPDEDVDSCLRQLAELGAFDGLPDE